MRNVLVLVAMLMLTACVSGEYYCDVRGCFLCDGVGCTVVVPPARIGCVVDATCGSNAVCTELGCTVGCVVTDDCARGWVCRTVGSRNICVAPSEDPSCQRNLDCAVNTVCTNGLCVPQSYPFCVSSASCAPGSSCLSGQCRRECTSMDDCQRTDVTYRYCTRIRGNTVNELLYCQTAHEPCVRASDCPGTGQTCVSNVCMGG